MQNPSSAHLEENACAVEPAVLSCNFIGWRANDSLQLGFISGKRLPAWWSKPSAPLRPVDGHLAGFGIRPVLFGGNFVAPVCLAQRDCFVDHVRSVRGSVPM